MTDNRDGISGSDGIGGGGAAPPPFPEAAPPVPAAPPAPVAPPAPYPAAPAGSAPWGWIVAAILAAALIILVCLYFFTSLLDKAPRDSWESGGSSFSQSGSGSGSGSSVLGSSGSTGSGQSAYQAPPPSPPPVATAPVAGYAPTAGWLAGTWGPACPGSAAQAITLFSDGRLSAQGGEGNWSLDGYTVTLNGNGRTLVTRWEYLSQDMARVTQVANGRVETVRRCL